MELCRNVVNVKGVSVGIMTAVYIYVSGSIPNKCGWPDLPQPSSHPIYATLIGILRTHFSNQSAFSMYSSV